MKLADLFSEKLHLLPHIQQSHIYSKIHERVKAMGMKMWKIGDPVQNRGRRILVGIDEAKREAAELVDSLYELHGDVSIEIFMVWDRKSHAEFDMYIPNIGPVYHVPVVGIWQDGILLEKGSGHKARQILNAEIERLKISK